MSLIEELKKDYIETLVEVYDYTEEEANENWSYNGEKYLIRVFDDMTDRLLDCLDKG